jgi:dipeptidyl aminopeptidase/acylaminoacyl peptidase
MQFRLFALSALVAVLLVGGAYADPIVTTDLLRLRTVDSIDVSSDGSKAVLAVRSITSVPGEKGNGPDGGLAYTNSSHLYLLHVNRIDDGLRRLTFGAASDSAPQISPDGSSVAFVRTDEGSGALDEEKGQVWIMPLDGGEARQITDFPNGAGAPRFSPDGRRLLVTAVVSMDDLAGTPPWPMERPGRAWNDTADDAIKAAPAGSRVQIRAWLAQNAAQGDPQVINRLDFQGEWHLRGPMQFRQLFLVDLESKDLSTRRVTDGFFDHDEAEFMPDGRRIVYVSRQTAEVHPDRTQDSALWILDIEDGTSQPLLARAGWRFSLPHPSMDGSVVAFIGSPTDEPAFSLRRIGLATVSNDSQQQMAWLTDPENFDASVDDVEWMTARSALIFNVPLRGGVPLMRISQGLLEPAPVVTENNGYPVGVHAFGVGGGAIVYAATSPTNPCTLRVNDSRGDRLAADLNPWVADKDLSLPQEGWVSRPDGMQVHYWVMQPTNRREGATYPVCLEIHGGPSAMWGPGEASMWLEFQLLCSWGYAVVYANPRGSEGYGYAFQKANFQQWGEAPAGDVLAALDEALRLHEDLDESRLVVTGGSYAGYLTAWIVAHDDRFKAAVAQRGVYHLATFFGEGNAWQLVKWAMGGLPWEARISPILDRESPFTYVNRIRTPLLIMHASNDLRTGVSQSEMMYRALKALDRPVEYVRYPNAGHDLSRSGNPRQRMDRLDRIIEFFERYVENPRKAPRAGADAPGTAGPR